MDNDERVVKHLEFIQGIVNRLDSNASLLIFYVIEILFVSFFVGSLWIAGKLGSGKLLNMILNTRVLERTDGGSNRKFTQYTE